MEKVPSAATATWEKHVQHKTRLLVANWVTEETAFFFFLILTLTLASEVGVFFPSGCGSGHVFPERLWLELDLVG